VKLWGQLEHLRLSYTFFFTFDENREFRLKIQKVSNKTEVKENFIKISSVAFF
jgi:hypothetical protein